MLPMRWMVLGPITAVSLLVGIGCGSSSGGGDSSNPTAGTGGANSSGHGSGDTGTGGVIFASGGPGSGGSGSGGGDCSPPLTGTVRDFKAYNGGAGHPDFETYTGNGMKGIVKDTLGPDHKPVYAANGPTAFTSGPAAFDQWYRDTQGVNIAIPFTITPTVDAKGIATYNNNAFFPIDNKGWGNEGNPHNFHFTYELHMTFVYKGGEVFSFTGDDDLWVFVNNHLAIDLGGTHPAQSDTLNLDQDAQKLGIAPGKEYALDFFQAERHTTESNFSIQSTLAFTNCTPIVY